jgi:manganese peroxidase
LLQAYASEYIRLSLLGVNNINDLTECTKALPGAFGNLFTFINPDQGLLNKFLGGELDSAREPLRKGDKISGR